MTKRKPPTTKTKPQDIEQTPGQKYEAQLRRVVDEWAEKVSNMLAEDIRALETPPGVREIEPQTSDAALLRRLESIGRDAVKGWVVLPSRPSPAEMPRQKPNKESVERAEQRRRIEDGYTYTVDIRRFINEDRQRAGLTPLPPSEDEALTSDK